jgi:hypothetical protein
MSEKKVEIVKKKLEPGMYNCKKKGGKFDGEEVVYHSSTAETLRDKGLIVVGKRIKEYYSPTHKR